MFAFETRDSKLPLSAKITLIPDKKELSVELSVNKPVIVANVNLVGEILRVIMPYKSIATSQPSHGPAVQAVAKVSRTTNPEDVKSIESLESMLELKQVSIGENVNYQEGTQTPLDKTSVLVSTPSQQQAVVKEQNAQPTYAAIEAKATLDSLRLLLPGNVMDATAGGFSLNFSVNAFVQMEQGDITTMDARVKKLSLLAAAAGRTFAEEQHVLEPCDINASLKTHPATDQTIQWKEINLTVDPMSLMFSYEVCVIQMTSIPLLSQA